MVNKLDNKYMRYFQQALGLITITVLAVSVYYSYKVFAYIMNWEQGNSQTYGNYMLILIYLLFLLTSTFLVYETLKRRGTRAQ